MPTRRHNEIEDGMGFAGLIPTKEDRYIDKLETENKRLRKEKETRVAFQDLIYKAMDLIDEKLSSDGKRHRCTNDSFLSDLKRALAGGEES